MKKRVGDEDKEEGEEKRGSGWKNKKKTDKKDNEDVK
jgi:hypothetical protein